tara:strand:+ start:374 stop:628 length:255 start_codon:yes stop_codon:yes gene_type:complete
MLRKVLRKVIDAVKELEEIEEIEGVDKYENKSLINMVGLGRVRRRQCWNAPPLPVVSLPLTRQRRRRGQIDTGQKIGKLIIQLL